jgi:uncharacterized protein (TIGR03437 family)
MRLRGLILFLAFVAFGYAQPSVAGGGVVNAASFKTPVAPGSLVSIFGTNLATKLAQADSIPLSKSLGGVTVQFVNGSNSINAPLLFVFGPGASSQINCQVPWNIVPEGASQDVNVVVTVDGTSSAPVAVPIGPVSPGVFATPALQAIAVNLDGTLAQPAGSISGLTTHPAKVGDTIIVYATGLGAVDIPVDDGAASLDKLRNTKTKPTVLIGGVSANVPFSGLSPQFVGVNQLNIVIPDIPAGDKVSLQIQMGGITSPNNVTIGVTR